MLRSKHNARHGRSALTNCRVLSRAQLAAAAIRLLCSLAITIASTFSHAALVTVTPVGADEFVLAPTWRAVDFNLFTAATGLLPAAELLPPATHLDLAELRIGPAEPHDAPYDFEISDALAAAGLVDAFEFAEDVIDGSTGNAIYFAFNIIADPDNASIGMTPDGEQAMLPLDLFGLDLSVVLSRVSQAGVAEVLGEFLIVLAAPDPDLFPDFTLEGVSHLPFFFALDPAVLPPNQPVAGDYRLQFALRDSGGNGYDLVSDLAVQAVSAPGTATLMAPLLGLCVAGLALRRNRSIARNRAIAPR